jgi:Tol biopolymer transport system component
MMQLITLTAVAYAVAAGGAAAATHDLQLVSRAGGATGVKGNDGSGTAALAAGGRFVAFSSTASNLDPGDVDALSDVFVRDLQTGAVLLVSRASGAGGAKGNASSGTPSISADGRFVAFASTATNLAAGDTDPASDVFVRDLVANTTALVSRSASAGVKGNADAFTPAISAGGRFVAFASNASNLLADDPDVTTDIYVSDLQSGGLALVSRADGVLGTKGSSGSTAPRISADGTRIVFSSNAPNLDPEDPDPSPDVFVRDVRAGTTTLVSRAAGGGASNGDAFSPTISADGRFVAFGSSATNLLAEDTDPITDVFVRDLQAGTMLLASRAGGAAGAKGDGFSDEPSIAGDGRSVTFVSNATNLHPDDTDVIDDVFVRDLVGSSTRLVSRASALAKGNGFSQAPSISDDGGVVSFTSNSANLAPEDPDTLLDVFVRDVRSAPPGAAAGSNAGATGRPQPGCPLRGQQIVGTPRADRRDGTAGIDILVGLGGNDVLRALGGSDCAFGGNGNDRLSGGAGDDRAFGQAGNDRLRGERGDDRLDGGPGDDSLDGGAGADRLTDARGRDRFAGGSGADRVNARDRTSRDRRRADVVRCGPGRDVAFVDRADRVAGDCEQVRRR